MKSFSLRLCLCALGLSLALGIPSWATCGGGGGGGCGGVSGSGGSVYSVAWHKVSTSDDMKPGLTVLWLPSSQSDFDGSPLKTSRILSLRGAGCIDMCYAETTSSVAQRFLGDATAPIAYLIAPDGSVVAKADNGGASLTVPQVEALVESEVSQREKTVNQSLSDAAAKAQAGETQAAIDELRSVVKQECLFPKQAREATKRLKKLGVTDVSSLPAAPNFDAAVGQHIQHLMKKGLQAEEQGQYFEAERLYTSAHRLDPADPTPLRYLGELYRHHIGDWKAARNTFNELLALNCDPISRAVALHGLGKMTIHEGEFKKGLSLMEESVKTYPLAMAYRNLAVYWNSEGDSAKAQAYTQKAMQMDPHDPYNLVFAAVFMAASGHQEEALKIAADNMGLLPASYNLAAIYAQNGKKQEALSLLKRHFYEYERFQAVREKEMMEARVDAVFASLKHDADFLALTNQADGRLDMPGGR
jgi:tetratricopeptide (TPR) repeat protein